MRLLGILIAVLMMSPASSTAQSAEKPSGDPATSSHWSFGGEVRVQYERFANEEWGAAPDDDNGYLLQRYIFGIQRRVNAHVTARAELKSGIEIGRVGGPRVPDEDRLDVHQAYVELTAPRAAFRIGRQELQFGSSRLVSARDLNVRQSFDAIRVVTRAGRWQLDLVGGMPATTKLRIFDDRTDTNRSLWGAYGVYTSRSVSPKGADLYYLGYRNRVARFDSITGAERRHSIGARLWGRRGALDYNLETIGQWGHVDRVQVKAWTVASQTGYRVVAPFPLRVILRADTTSGDRERDDHALGTFNALFPKGDYFGLIASAGPSNHSDLYPQVEIPVSPRMVLTAGWLMFWRNDLDDGLYAFSGRLLRSGRRTASRFVGNSPGLTLGWEPRRRLSILGHMSIFTAGPFIRETGGRRSAFVRFCATYRFTS